MGWKNFNMKKVLMVQWLKAPSKVNKFINENKIKQKDIVSICRSPRGEVEIWYFCKKPKNTKGTECEL